MTPGDTYNFQLNWLVMPMACESSSCPAWLNEGNWPNQVLGNAYADTLVNSMQILNDSGKFLSAATAMAVLSLMSTV